MNRRSFLTSAAAVSTALVVAPRSLVAARSRINEMQFYEVDGRTVFPFFAPSGVITTRVAMLPVVFEEKLVTTVLMFGHYIDDLVFIPNEYKARFIAQEMIQSLSRFDNALRNGKPIIDREEGGAVPEDGEIVRFYPRKEWHK